MRDRHKTECNLACVETGGHSLFSSPSSSAGSESPKTDKSASDSITITTTTTLKLEITNNTGTKSLDELIITQEAVRNIWHTKKYLDTYISYLLGGMTEEEFDKASDSFVREGKNILTPEQLCFCASYLKALLPDVELDDVAEILKVEYNDLEALVLRREVR